MSNALAKHDVVKREDQEIIRPRSGTRVLSIALSMKKTPNHRNGLSSGPIHSKLPGLNMDAT